MQREMDGVHTGSTQISNLVRGRLSHNRIAAHGFDIMLGVFSKWGSAPKPKAVQGPHARTTYARRSEMLTLRVANI